MEKQFLEIGQIVSTHGIKGEVRVNPWCDSPDFLLDFDYFYVSNNKQKYKKMKIINARIHKNIAIMIIEDVNTVELAQGLRNSVLYIDKNDVELDKDVFFIQDLIGVTVVDNEDESVIYGTITDISQTGANDVYHITTKHGKVLLMPAISQVVKSTDINKKVMKITPLKGLFDDED